MRRGAEPATPPPARDAGAEKLLAQYLSHLANERRLSPNTVSNYARDVRALLDLTADAALAKPFRRDELIAVVNAQLSAQT